MQLGVPSPRVDRKRRSRRPQTERPFHQRGRRDLVEVMRRADQLLRRRPVLVATLVGCALYLAAASSPTTGFWSHRFVGDSDVYGYYAQQVHDGHAPYRDFQIEY